MSTEWFWTAVTLPSYLAFAVLCGLVRRTRERWRTMTHQRRKLIP